MKKIKNFAIIALAAMSLLSLGSCDKENKTTPTSTPTPIPTPIPTPTTSVHEHNLIDGKCQGCDYFESIGLKYQLVDDEYKVVGIGDCEDLNVSIPAIYNGKKVTTIGELAFRNCTNITNIILPEGITTIEEYAFTNCYGLTSMVVPNTVVSIEEGAFRGCNAIESLTLPFVGSSATATTASESTLFGYVFGSVLFDKADIIRQTADTNIYHTFYIPTSLKSVTITGGKIFTGAFYNCGRIEEIVLDMDIDTISPYAFFRCQSLISVQLPEGLKSIDGFAFDYCYKLKNINIPEGVTNIGDLAFYMAEFEEIELPESLETIGSGAFVATNIKSIKIPSKVKEIHTQFSYCTKLEVVIMDKGVTNISSNPFDGCYKLQAIYYTGTLVDWNKITFESNPTVELTNKLYFYSETQPTTSGNFWHYDSNNQIVKW